MTVGFLDFLLVYLQSVLYAGYGQHAGQRRVVFHFDQLLVFDEMTETRTGLRGGTDTPVNGHRVRGQQYAVFAVRHARRVHAGQDGRAYFHADAAVQQGPAVQEYRVSRVGSG